MAVRFKGTVALASMALAWILAAQPVAAQSGAAAPSGVEAPQRRGALRAQFRGHVQAADAALAAGRPDEARAGIARAEAMLQRPARPGRERMIRASQALEAARGAVDRGAYQEARAALRPLLSRPAPDRS